MLLPEERPILVLDLCDGAQVTEEAMRAHLAGAITKWWMPDRILFDAVPLTATGKIDKKTLRARYANCLVETLT